MHDARGIYQAFLDRTSRLLWERRLEALAARMAYPHPIRTSDRDATVEDAAMLIAFARSFRENLAEMGATAYHRVCREARWLEPGAIEGHHTAYVLRGATPLLTPFHSVQRIERRDGRWLGAGIVTDTRNADIHINIAPLKAAAPAAAGGKTRR